MLFPKEKMSHTSTYKGNKSDEGWLVLNIGNMELEGVSKLYIDLRDIDEVKQRSSKESDALERAKRLLGGD
jgi:hypothetical protein